VRIHLATSRGSGSNAEEYMKSSKSAS
jgi:hypothetical protein